MVFCSPEGRICPNFTGDEMESTDPLFPRHCSPDVCSTVLCISDSLGIAKVPENRTYTISPVWDIEKNEVQHLVHFNEEDANFYSLQESSQLNMIDNYSESCLLDTAVGMYKKLCNECVTALLDAQEAKFFRTQV